MRPLLCLLLCIGCTGGGKLGYQITHIEFNDQDCLQEKEACFVANLNFPEFEGLDSIQLLHTNKIIGNTIMDALGLGDVESSGQPDIQAALNSVAKQFEKVKNSFNYSAGWIADVQTLPIYEDDTILVFALETMIYFGGAHPNTNRVYFNLNRMTGKKLPNDWLHALGIEEEAEAIFRSLNNLKPDNSLDEAGFLFPNNEFRLPANYAFKGDSIILFYNRYEIAPYASGATEIIVPVRQ